MTRVDVHGHSQLRQRLLDSFERGTLPQSMLLHGPAGIGKQTLGLWLGSVLLCEGSPAPCGVCRQCRYQKALTHPDFTWVFPRPRLKDSDASPEDVKLDLASAIAERVEAGNLYAQPPGNEGIYVPTIRMVVRSAVVTPAIARRKVILVGNAERMVSQEGSDQAANAFLKLLEEPPANTWIFLTSSAPGALLPTIRSRVVAVRVSPLSAAEVSGWLADPEVRDRLNDAALPPTVAERVAMAEGSPGRLLEAKEGRSATDAARRLLDAASARDMERGTRLALAAGASGARGVFTDVLESLASQLMERTRSAVREGDERVASAVARAIAQVEEAKALAYGNGSPQLITHGLFVVLADALNPRR